MCTVTTPHLVATNSIMKRNCNNSNRITSPQEYDVLCIKDKTWAKHKGNQIYRSKVLSYAYKYDVASKQEKMKLTREIVDMMSQEYNSRFLRLMTSSSNDEGDQDGVWEIITDKQARDKTSHALRFAVKASHKALASPNATVDGNSNSSDESSSNSYTTSSCEMSYTSSKKTTKRKTVAKRNTKKQHVNKMTTTKTSSVEETKPSILRPLRRNSDATEHTIANTTIASSTFNNMHGCDNDDDEFSSDDDIAEDNHCQKKTRHPTKNTKTDHDADSDSESFVNILHRQQQIFQDMSKSSTEEYESCRPSSAINDGSILPEDVPSSLPTFNKSTKEFLEMSLSIDDEMFFTSHAEERRKEASNNDRDLLYLVGSTTDKDLMNLEFSFRSFDFNIEEQYTK